MSAWRSLLLLLVCVLSGVALSHQDDPVPNPSLGVSNEPPKSWGTMDGKSPFRMIADDR